MTMDINNLWLGRLQQELGVLSSNVMLLTLQRDALQEKVQADAALIEALKARCQAAESANEDLRMQIQPQVTARVKARGKEKQGCRLPSDGKAHGTHPAQPA